MAQLSNYIDNLFHFIFQFIERATEANLDRINLNKFKEKFFQKKKHRQTFDSKHLFFWKDQYALNDFFNQRVFQDCQKFI